MKVLKKGLVLWLAIGLSCFYLSVWAKAGNGSSPAGKSVLPVTKTRQIEDYVRQRIKASKIPGLILVIVKGNQVVYNRGFGYADLGSQSAVTPDTFFEIGSNSKAYTALGILRLQSEGKLQISDPVSKYLPWFYMKFQGHRVNITIEQLLHQTSGVPFKSIQDIPVSQTGHALEDTVRTLVGKELAHKPGESFLYATINYDVLGLIIQQISGESFENYMTAEVLKPLGLNNTFLFRRNAVERGLMATGYKTSFRQSLAYDAPRYRGNTPAGYFITSGRDVGEWLKIQLGSSGSPVFRRLIQESHTPDDTVRPGGDGSFYGMGWFTTRVGGREIYHGGANPNFSSFMILRPDQRMGVAILSNHGNIESPDIQFIAQGVMKRIGGGKPAGEPADSGQSMDNMATTITYIAIVLILFIMVMMTIFFIDLWQGRRKYRSKGFKGLIQLSAILILVTLIGYGLYLIPDVMLQGFHWSFVLVWGPISIPVAVTLIFGALVLFFLYYVLIVFFPKSGEKPYFPIVILSIASAFGNTFSIFTVYAVVGADQKRFATTLCFYFILGTIIYLLGLRVVRMQMFALTNELIYVKRISMIDRILNASYRKIEALEAGKIPAGLSGDTEVVSNFVNVLVTGITNLITLICCFVYLGVLNYCALLISIFIVAVAAVLYYYAGKSAERDWEKTRDIQNKFFKLISDLEQGFKELFLNRSKKTDFACDIRQACETYRERRLAGEYKFINVHIIGELIFGVVIGTVAFVFPYLFKDMNQSELRIYLFIFLYMNLPVHGILNNIPSIFQFRISWRRINQLLEEIATLKSELTPQEPVPWGKNSAIGLYDVKFQYRNEPGGEFAIGPLNADFRTSQITFITGGNGSGKSTLAKLITGLYSPDQGEIRIDGIPVSFDALSQHYSAVFSDFHLFPKLYGIEYPTKKADAEKYLNTLRIANKVRIQDGVFDTLALSTGQRKRLALLVCFLEDRPVYLFDEWAADQDVEFRKYFYQELLPELRQKGKCVIAITHDERYFGIADQVIKMELGQIVEIKLNHHGESGNFVETA